MTRSSATNLAGGRRPAVRGAGTGARRVVIMAAVALSLVTSSLALADPPSDRGHDGDRHEWRHDDHDRGDRHDWRRDDHDRGDRREWRRDDHREWRREDHDRGEHWAERRRDDDGEGGYRERFDAGRYWRPHGYYEHQWHRGERLPIQFRAGVYVIPDIAMYHLRPPPPGYYWVRVDNNAVLAAVTTGVVVDIAYHLFH